MNVLTRLALPSFLALALTSLAPAAVETYAIDPVHSSVAFSIRHFVSKVPGSFTKFDGTVTVDRDNMERSSVQATIEIGSVDTSNEKRDTHLKSADFFDATKFSSISFKSKSWKKTAENMFDVSGDLTIKDVTKPVVLKVNLLGFGAGRPGTMLSGWEAKTTIKRGDFGIKGFEPMLGEDVEVTINIEAGLKK